MFARNVARDLGSNGSVGAGRIAVNFLAQDTAETIAVRIQQAANTAGFAGLSASVNGNIVQFVGADIASTTGSARTVGIAPGGLVTGIAQVGAAMFAVSNQGGLYRVSLKHSTRLATPTSRPTLKAVTTSSELTSRD